MIRRTRLRWNIVASFAGATWSALVSLLLVPLYIHFLGMEAWGLVGFFTAIQSILIIAEAGLSTTLNRELARLRPNSGERRKGRDLLRTLEVVYWLLAVAIGGLLVITAPIIARRWLNPTHLSASTAAAAIRLMGLTVVMQMPQALYMGGLLGLQQQVRLNIINTILITIRGVGTVAVLAFVSPTIIAFFIWQMVMSAANTGALAVTLWRQLRSDRRPRFRTESIRSVWRFSAGMVGIAVSGTLLAQMDKIVLSTTVSLHDFGYYALAAAAAAALLRLVSPLFQSLLPHIAELVSRGDEVAQRNVYHAGSQLAAVLMFPPAIVGALFSRPILSLWTGDAETARRAHPILSLLLVGYAFTGLTHLPYALELAYGKTRLWLCNNVISVAVLIPVLIMAVSHYGALGAATVWTVYSMALFLIFVPFVHHELLRGEMSTWYLHDNIEPALASLVVGVVGWLTFPSNGSALRQMLGIGATAALAVLAATFTARRLRGFILQTIRR